MGPPRVPVRGRRRGSPCCRSTATASAAPPGSPSRAPGGSPCSGRSRTRRAGATRSRRRWRRTVVVGDRLFTISELGAKASTLAGLADAGWVAFPEGAGTPRRPDARPMPLDPLAQHPEDAAHDVLLQRLALARVEEVADRVGAAALRGPAARRGAGARRGTGRARSARRPGRGAGARRRRPSRPARISRALCGVGPRAVLRPQRRRLRRAVERRRTGPCSTTAPSIRVWTTGVGTPFSDSRVTAASPVPTEVSSVSTS